jgi:uncharacterized protein (DUF1499 family)
MIVRYLMAGAVGLGLLAATTWMLRAWPIINVVETGLTPDYPDIQPRAYRQPVERVFDGALHAIQRLPRWSLVSYRAESGEIRAEATTRVLRFHDDVLIRVTRRGGETVVTARSASRIGRGDFGQNARNIRAFFQELDRQVSESTHPTSL